MPAFPTVERQPQAAPLNDQGQQAVVQLLQNDAARRRLLARQKKAALYLQKVAGDVNDRAYHARKRHGIRLRRLEADEEEEPEEELEEYNQYQDQVKDVTDRLDLGMRGIVDDIDFLAGLPDALKVVAVQSGAVAEETQRTPSTFPMTTQNSRRAADDEDEDTEIPEDDEQPATTQLDQSHAPTALLQAALQKQTSAWNAMSLTDRYAKSNEYKGFYTTIYDSKNPDRGEDEPVPHETLWFADEEGRQADTVVSRVGDGDDEDDDIQVDHVVIRIKCPFTMRAFVDPVTSKKCPHSFERSAFYEVLKTTEMRLPLTPEQEQQLVHCRNQAERKRKEKEIGTPALQCPECAKLLAETDVERDPVLQRKVKRMVAEKQIDDEADEESDDEEEDAPRGTQRKPVGLGSSPPSKRGSGRVHNFKAESGRAAQSSMPPGTQSTTAEGQTVVDLDDEDEDTVEDIFTAPLTEIRTKEPVDLMAAMGVMQSTGPVIGETASLFDVEAQVDVPEDVLSAHHQPAPNPTECVKQTIEGAKYHIARIRRDKGLDLGVLDGDLGSNVSDLTAALEVLSDQLYTQPTHFLLEFIQNADDNTYGNDEDGEPVIPTIKFHNFSGSLNITCNEVGFQPKNVDAICRIAKSTKQDRSKGFIGEKGIGFKSVFKIANVVHVSSNSYSFHFNRKGPLGMIAPIWSDFPGQIREDHTQFLLQLSQENSGQAEKDLRKQLKLLDSTLLLFLRNLRQISVFIDDGTGTVGGKFTEDLCRIDYEQYAGKMVRIQGDRKRLRKLVEDTEYLVVRHTATGMPSEPRRRGMSSSEVVLAFPFKDGNPTFFRQKAYAFLPIRESGFKFLLQADFILIANREDMILHSDWNQALLNGLAECFVKAVERFNHIDARPLRYTWLGFLRDMPSTDLNNFADLGEQITTALTYRPVLESQSGDFIQPSEAIFVPSQYSDGDGYFLLDKSTHDDDIKPVNHERKYLAPQYEQHDPDHIVLQRLGVEVMAFPRFLDMLRAYVSEELEHYCNRPESWHSRVAQVLLDLVSSIHQVQNLPLIPLRNSKWVTKIECQCYFETNDSKVLSKLPEGIEDLRIVHQGAAEDAIRRKLLGRLGVKPLDRVEVCRLLSVFHSSPNGPELSVDSLISHARYLYEVHRAGAHFAKPEKFWVHDISGNPQKATSLYLDNPEADSRSLSSMLPPERWSARLLHPAYLKEYKGKQLEKWARWLESYLGLRSTIRIASSENQFTPEFTFLLENLETEELLEVILSSWNRDSTAFTKVVRDMLGAITVTCEDGTKIRLSQTCLATPSLKRMAVPGLPFLLLKDSEAAKWKKLRDLGVCVVPGLSFYLRCLSLVKGTVPPSRAALLSLYKSIDAYLHENIEAFRDYFKINAAIYLPAKNLWVNKSNCVWDPTPGVSDEHALSDTYPELYNLFFYHLQVRSATIEKVISELKEMNVQGQEDSRLRKLLLLSLNSFLRRTPRDYAKLHALENVPVMPIAGKYGMDTSQLASLNKATWLFADRHDYHKSFVDRGNVRFADFDVETYPKLEALATAISKAWSTDGQRCLSSLVTEIKDVGESVVYNLQWTALFRDKLRFLRRLIKVGAGYDIKRKLDMLHGSKVYSAPFLSVKTYLTQGQLGKSIEGVGFPRQALHKTSMSELKFYARSDSNAWDFRISLGQEFCSFGNITDGRYQMIVQNILLQDDYRQIYDMLMGERIGGEDAQPYVPQPVQPLEVLPAPTTSRQPLANVSGNIKQSTAKSDTKELPVSTETPAAIGNTALVPLPMPQFDPIDQIVPLGTSVYQGATLGPQQGQISAREALQTSRLREVQAAVRIGGPPPSDTASRLQPTDAENYFAVYDPKSASRPGLAGSSRAAINKASIASIMRQHSTSPLFSTDSVVRYARAKTEQEFVREQNIGIQGETKVWNLLKEILGDDLDCKCWTSELRIRAKLGLPRWQPEDANMTYGDFTVPDQKGFLTSWLLKNGIDLPRVSNMKRTYHIEVKSTVGPSHEPFHMSQLQMLRSEELSGNADEMFLVFRLFELDTGNGGMEIHADPWKLIKDGRLSREAESWLVQ